MLPGEEAIETPDTEVPATDASMGLSRLLRSSVPATGVDPGASDGGAAAFGRNPRAARLASWAEIRAFPLITGSMYKDWNQRLMQHMRDDRLCNALELDLPVLSGRESWISGTSLRAEPVFCGEGRRR